MSGDLPLFDPFKVLADIRREGVKLPAAELPQAPAEEFREPDHKLNPTSATSARGPAAHTLAPARVKEEERKENSIITHTYARGEPAQGVAPARGRSGAAEVAEPAEVLPSASVAKVLSEKGSAEVLEGGLRKWRSGLARLSSEHPPCPGYRADDWPRTLSRALDFLDTFGSQAEALGWTASRLFGVHAEAGIVRVDACGALVLPIGGLVRAITATEIAFSHLTHCEKPGQVKGLPIWEFGR